MEARRRQLCQPDVCSYVSSQLQDVMNLCDARRKQNVLQELVHSTTECTEEICTPACLMFRRIRQHVESVRFRQCALFPIYSSLLEEAGLPLPEEELLQGRQRG